MHQIRLDNTKLYKIILRNILYFFFNFYLLIKNEKIRLKLNQNIQIKISNIIDYKFIFQKNQKVELSNSIFLYEKEESNKIISYSNKDFLFFDLGSHHGYFSFLATSYFKTAISIESSKKFYNNQIRIKNYNNLENLNIYNLAIGDGSNIKYQDYISRTTSKSVTLSNFINTNFINDKIFLKIDINGFEKFCLDDLNNINLININFILIDIYLNKIFDRINLLNAFKKISDKYKYLEVLLHIKNQTNIFNKCNFNELDIIFSNNNNKIVTFFLHN